ncbi:hypothetical protein [Clostridium oceanicum]|uniref:DUF4180 domain-containing protein n=1 Tax=Clostridium oceanicum TaxID=1543 RepID=A0ABN1JRN6_9CLOT
MIKNICFLNGSCNLKVIDETMGNIKIKDIISGIDFYICDCYVLDERIILFNNLSDKELDTLTKDLKNILKRNTIFHIIDSKSINLEFKYLVSKLIEKRDFNENKRYRKRYRNE